MVNRWIDNNPPIVNGEVVERKTITSVDDLDPFAIAVPAFQTDFTGEKFFGGLFANGSRVDGLAELRDDLTAGGEELMSRPDFVCAIHADRNHPVGGALGED